MGAPQIIVVGADNNQRQGYGSRRSRRKSDSAKKKEEEKKKKEKKKWTIFEIFLVLTFLSPIVGELFKLVNLYMIAMTHNMNVQVIQTMKGLLP